MLNNSLGSGEEKSKSVIVTCPIKNNQLGQEMSVLGEQRSVETGKTAHVKLLKMHTNGGKQVRKALFIVRY